MRAGVDCFVELPEQEWDLPTDTRTYIGSSWAEDVPTGNMRLTLKLCPLLEYTSVAQMQANLRERELQLANNRLGTLELLEGYHQGAPFLRTRWRAVVLSIAPRQLLELDEALCDPGHPASSLQGAANGALEVTFSLSNPQKF